jgi:hypothetical protein
MNTTSQTPRPTDLCRLTPAVGDGMLMVGVDRTKMRSSEVSGLSWSRSQGLDAS